MAVAMQTHSGRRASAFIGLPRRTMGTDRKCKPGKGLGPPAVGDKVAHAIGSPKPHFGDQ
jgi:hypothetical protein